MTDFILKIYLPHFGSKLLVDFYTYNTQILYLTGAMFSEAHFNDKYNYVQITHTPRSSTLSRCIPRVLCSLYYKDTKTKCRLYWCLKEFIDRRYSQSCWYFRPSLVNIAPVTFSLVLKYSIYVKTVCGWAVGEGGGC
jgi:hypothetical protein